MVTSELAVIGVARFNPTFLKAGPGNSNLKIADLQSSRLRDPCPSVV